MQHFAVNGGVLEVDGKNLRFIADDITTEDEVSEKAAEEALVLAEKMVSEAGTQTALAEAHRLLSHSRAQINLAQLKRRHHS